MLSQLHLASTCSPDTPSFLFSLHSETPWKNHCLKLPLLYFFNLIFKIEVSLIYNVVPISVVQQSNSVVCIYTLFSYILFHYALSEDIIFPCAVYSRTCCMPVPNVIVCTCQPQTPSVPTSPSPPLLHFLTLSSWALACAIPSKQLLWMSTIIFFFLSGLSPPHPHCLLCH